MERVCLWSVLLGVLLMIIVLIIERLLKSLSQLLLTGRAELLAQAAQLLPPTTRYDTQNSAGLTALMIASIRNDEVALHALLDAGCDPNVEVPPAGSAGYPAIQPDTQHWTALSFAASRANYVALRILLERGGKVEGGARSSEEKCTLTPFSWPPALAIWRSWHCCWPTEPMRFCPRSRRIHCASQDPHRRVASAPFQWLLPTDTDRAFANCSPTPFHLERGMCSRWRRCWPRAMWAV